MSHVYIWKKKPRRSLEFKFKKGKQNIIPQEIKEMLASLNRLAQNDLKLHNALERLNLVLVIYIIWKGPKQDSPKRPKVT
jgi:hypothetical protein